MRIQNVNSGQKASYSLSGTVLTLDVDHVKPLAIDLQERQGDVSKVVDVSLDSSFSSLGEGVGSWYIATVDIPPKSYELYDTGNNDENGDAIMGKRVIPLNTSDVTLHLWGLPQNIITKVEEV